MNSCTATYDQKKNAHYNININKTNQFRFQVSGELSTLTDPFNGSSSSSTPEYGTPVLSLFVNITKVYMYRLGHEYSHSI